MVSQLAERIQVVSHKLAKYFAKECLLCSEIIETQDANQQEFCSCCLPQLKRNLICCEHCAIPMPSSQQEIMVCGACQTTPPLWQKAHSTFLYKYPLKKLVAAFKYERRLDLIKVMASNMADDLEISYPSFDTRPDCIVPIPLHALREFNRGYNQSELLAKQLSKRLNISLNRNLIKRVRATPKQSNLNKRHRQKNLRNAFAVNTKATIPKYIALIDDVMTTGATLEAATQTLLNAGVERVDVWCLARAD